MSVPDRALVEAKLAVVSTVVGDVLQRAITKSRDFFEPGMDFDWTLFTVRARYEAAALFRLAHLESSNDPDPITTQTVSNIGLQLYYEEILIKVLKGRELPVPSTVARVRFYENTETQVIVDGRNDLRPVKLNVVYLWDCDPQTKEMNYYSLVCPRSGGFKRDEVSIFWAIPLAIPKPQVVVPSRKEMPAVLADLEIAPLSPDADAVHHDATSGADQLTEDE